MSITENKCQVPLLILVGFVLRKGRDGICKGFWGGEISVGLKAVLRGLWFLLLLYSFSAELFIFNL